jgi:membrane-associated protease RseP (regulator of RpoE activity)
VVVTVKASGGVRGRLVDATTKAPVADAFVSFEDSDPTVAPEGTGSDGRFVIESATVGPHILVVSPDRTRESKRLPVTLVESQVVDLGDIELGPPKVLPGLIGARVGHDGQQLFISMVTPAGPAARAGLQVGDVLLAVDGTPVTSLPEAIKRLNGAPGSTVVLKVRRAGAEQSVSVTRAS